MLSVSGPTVTVDAKRTGSVLTGAAVLDATHEGHILAMLASPSAVTGTIKFVGDVSPFDALGGPAVWQGEALSSLFAAVSTITFPQIVAFTGHTAPTADDVAVTMFANLLVDIPAPFQSGLVLSGSTIIENFPFGDPAIGAITTSSTMMAPLSLGLTSVPEPSALLLLGSGLATLGGWTWGRSHRA